MLVTGLRATLGPLYGTSLHLTDGLNVLYGLNGAGKTTLLEAFKAGFNGVLNSRYGYEYVSMLVALPEPVFWYASTGAGQDPDAIAKSIRARLESATHASSPPEMREEFLGVAQNTHLAAASPIGVGEGRWKTSICVPQDDPVVMSLASVERRLLAGLQADLREAHEDDDADEANMNLFLFRMRSLFLQELSDSGNSVDEEDPGMSLPNDGLPLPVADVDIASQIRHQLPLLISDVDGRGLDAATRNAAQHWVGYAPEVAAEAATRNRQLPSQNSSIAGFSLPGLDEWVAARQAAVNELINLLLLDAPTLELRIGSNAEWLIGRPLYWQSDGLPLDSLSRAQARWASLAIRLGLAQSPVRPKIRIPEETRALLTQVIPARPTYSSEPRITLVLDEPEAALHRTAEAHMAHGLRTLAADSGIQVVVATHSPELLNAADANVVRVYRQEGVRRYTTGMVTRTESLQEPQRAELDEYGLSPSDLLRRRRGFLLVEGHHEVVILGASIGNELTALGIEILPLRGATQLPATIDSRLLFDFTDAVIIAVLDNGDADLIDSVWETATTIAATEGPYSAGEFVRARLPAKERIEYKFLGQFLSRAIQAGLQSRVVPYAFEKLDIIEYLPVQRFAKNTSWASLRERHKREHPGRDFKTWLGQTFAARFDDKHLAEAVAALPAQPAEFRRLLDRCRDLAP